MSVHLSSLCKCSYIKISKRIIISFIDHYFETENDLLDVNITLYKSKVYSYKGNPTHFQNFL